MNKAQYITSAIYFLTLFFSVFFIARLFMKEMVRNNAQLINEINFSFKEFRDARKKLRAVTIIARNSQLNDCQNIDASYCETMQSSCKAIREIINVLGIQH